MIGSWTRTDPETGDEQTLLLAEAEPGVVHLTTESVEELLTLGGWEPSP